MELKVRALNSNEKYACNTSAVKKVFRSENVYISFGFSSRDFNFDTFDQEKPQIKGTVIASASINKRDRLTFESKHHISFYVIKDLKYESKAEKTFVLSCLPLLYKWYREVLAEPETSPSGVRIFLMEWHNGGFKTHSYRYR